MQDLTVTLVQTELFWEDIPRNLEKFTRLLSNISQETDVIVLPEMFSTGFTMNAASFAEEKDGPSMEWLRQTAVTRSADIVASLIIKEHGNYFNRLIWMHVDGSFDSYDKRHLFRMAGENKTYTPGNKKIVVRCKGWRICPLICYDLRFPVWSRNRGEFDAIFYVANWPEPRRMAWQVLLRARAIENQVYVVGVNRIGQDGAGKEYCGDSAVIDAAGEIISLTLPDQQSVETVHLSFKDLEEYRNKFQFRLDADPFEVK